MRRLPALLAAGLVVAGCGSSAEAVPAPTTGTVQRGVVTKQLILEGAMGGGNGAVVAAQNTVWREVVSGQPVTLYVDVVPDVAMRARVGTISPYETVLNQQRRYHYVNLEILDPIDPRLVPGQRVRAIIDTLNVPGVLTVSNKAVQTEGGQSLVVTPDGRRIPFTAGAVGDKVTEVRSGLAEGQQVQVRATP
jgi:hypothetical protein